MPTYLIKNCTDAINRVSTPNSCIFQLPPPKTSTLANTQTGEPCPTQMA